MTTNLCKDCRWGHCLFPGGEERPYDWQCRHESARIVTPPDPVVGRPPKDDWLSCAEARAFRNLCGPDGKFWEARAGLSGTIGFGEALDDL